MYLVKVLLQPNGLGKGRKKTIYGSLNNSRLSLHNRMFGPENKVGDRVIKNGRKHCGNFRNRDNKDLSLTIKTITLFDSVQRDYEQRELLIIFMEARRQTYDIR